ncbi:hypothetical protein TUM17580_10540 [Citrobacter farmeri]|nr:hypothetical protein TUM17580_10540 [Citrobacter farmeri]
MTVLLHDDKPRLVYFIVILCCELVIVREGGNEFFITYNDNIIADTTI